MNRKDRDAVDVIDAVLRQITGLTPANPADVKAIAQGFPTVVKAANALVMAIGSIRCGDWEGADFRLTEAARAVGLAGCRQCVRCARAGGQLSENGCPSCGPRADVRWVPERPFRTSDHRRVTTTGT